MLRAVTNSASKITVDPASNVVEVTGNAAGKIEVSVASDKTTGELFGTTVEVTGTEASITPTANGAVVKSGAQADIYRFRCYRICKLRECGMRGGINR
jgi:hypothetical protein